MNNTRVLMLQGNEGQAFFLKETLLVKGLAGQVDLVSQAKQAINAIKDETAYDMVIINLAEAWEQGLELSQWLSQRLPTCLVIFITHPEEAPRLTQTDASVVLPTPFSLQDFAQRVQAALFD